MEQRLCRPVTWFGKLGAVLGGSLYASCWDDEAITFQTSVDMLIRMVMKHLRKPLDVLIKEFVEQQHLMNSPSQGSLHRRKLHRGIVKTDEEGKEDEATAEAEGYEMSTLEENDPTPMTNSSIESKKADCEVRETASLFADMRNLKDYIETCWRTYEQRKKFEVFVTECNLRNIETVSHFTACLTEERDKGNDILAYLREMGLSYLTSEDLLVSMHFLSFDAGTLDKLVALRRNALQFFLNKFRNREVDILTARVFSEKCMDFRLYRYVISEGWSCGQTELNADDADGELQVRDSLGDVLSLLKDVCAWESPRPEQAVIREVVFPYMMMFVPPEEGEKSWISLMIKVLEGSNLFLKTSLLRALSKFPDEMKFVLKSEGFIELLISMAVRNDHLHSVKEYSSMALVTLLTSSDDYWRAFVDTSGPIDFISKASYPCASSILSLLKKMDSLDSLNFIDVVSCVVKDTPREGLSDSQLEILALLLDKGVISCESLISDNFLDKLLETIQVRISRGTRPDRGNGLLLQLASSGPGLRTFAELTTTCSLMDIMRAVWYNVVKKVKDHRLESEKWLRDHHSDYPGPDPDKHNYYDYYWHSSLGPELPYLLFKLPGGPQAFEDWFRHTVNKTDSEAKEEDIWAVALYLARLVYGCVPCPVGANYEESYYFPAATAKRPSNIFKEFVESDSYLRIVNFYVEVTLYHGANSVYPRHGNEYDFYKWLTGKYSSGIMEETEHLRAFRRLFAVKEAAWCSIAWREPCEVDSKACPYNGNDEYEKLLVWEAHESRGLPFFWANKNDRRRAHRLGYGADRFNEVVPEFSKCNRARLSEEQEKQLIDVVWPHAIISGWRLTHRTTDYWVGSGMGEEELTETYEALQSVNSKCPEAFPSNLFFRTAMNTGSLDYNDPEDEKILETGDEEVKRRQEIDEQFLPELVELFAVELMAYGVDSEGRLRASVGCSREILLSGIVHHLITNKEEEDVFIYAWEAKVLETTLAILAHMDSTTVERKLCCEILYLLGDSGSITDIVCKTAAENATALANIIALQFVGDLEAQLVSRHTVTKLRLFAVYDDEIVRFKETLVNGKAVDKEKALRDLQELVMTAAPSEDKQQGLTDKIAEALCETLQGLTTKGTKNIKRLAGEVLDMLQIGR